MSNEEKSLNVINRSRRFAYGAFVVPVILPRTAGCFFSRSREIDHEAQDKRFLETGRFSNGYDDRPDGPGKGPIGCLIVACLCVVCFLIIFKIGIDRFLFGLLAIAVLVAVIWVLVTNRDEIFAWIRRWNEERKKQKHEEAMRLAAERERLASNKAQVLLLITQKQFGQVYQFATTNNLKNMPEFSKMNDNIRSQHQKALSFMEEKNYKKAIPILTELENTPFDFGKKFIDDVKTAHNLKESVQYMSSVVMK